MNKELKQYLYMLVGKELTYDDKEKILSYFNDLKQEKDRVNKRNKKLKARIDKAIEYIENYLPYLEMVDYEYEDMNGDIKYVMKEWEGKELLDIIKGSDIKNGI